MATRIGLFKILICTDTHLGALEKSESRRDDCYKAFEEILSTARDQDVDFIIHSGDLFDTKNPTKVCLTRTMALLRKYLTGIPKNTYQVGSLSDMEYKDISFDDSRGIKYPMYIIHGNHDEPSGTELIAGLDILQTAGLVNFIGRDDKHTITELNEKFLRLEPIIFVKGDTKIALYGMSYKKGEEMNKIWSSQRVHIEQLDESENVFKVLLVHQDRVLHDSLKIVPEELFKGYFDFVVFGHEHMCQVATGKPWSIQPGSSFPLSICEFESYEKFIAVLQVEGSDYNVERIALRNVRQVFYKVEQIPTELEGSNNLSAVTQYIKDTTQEFFDFIEANNTHPEMAPMARIVFEYTCLECTVNAREIAVLFDKPLLNKGDCVKMKKKAIKREKKRKTAVSDDSQMSEDSDYEEEENSEIAARRKAIEIETYMHKEFEKNKIQSMPIIEIEKIIESIGNGEYEEKTKARPLEVLVNYCLEKAVEESLTDVAVNGRDKKMVDVMSEGMRKVRERAINEDDLNDKRDEILKRKEENPKKRKKTAKKTKKTKKAVMGGDVESEEEVDDNDEEEEVKTVKKKKTKKKVNKKKLLSLLKADDEF
ncbi:double-strand break repair protein MRE11, putative [Entamoeba invadens IP1]|uniref:Double-strand break repair protein n=1 Tax=Entamoeba invadens IP1 TaxID=370355 RepID=A0A0A1U858_ENTIV|nr:double-strand break repair protein MRE11, putative [Entamoeba invadens IP1]ELP91016.1 double-strand break repair protein MRE11, putative [Entamoeba invadens IP1]|eukprot:XP_004257787.1 double-strand break repair protein MRE11, putative [Entamoeba invadens IP1]